MKIRHGFVSNSSSSSFLIYGAELSGHRDELIEKFKIEDEDIDNYELAEIVSKAAGLEYETGPEGDAIYIGKSWSAVKDDETGLQFKTRIKEAIEKATGFQISCDTFSEAWRDG